MVLMVVCSIILLALGFYLYVMRDIPSVKVLKRLENKPVSSIYGVNNELMYLIVPDNRVFIEYNKIPQHVKDAFPAAEDAEFFKHGAIDYLSVVRALFKNITSGRVVQGGSTITQQVIKSLRRLALKGASSGRPVRQSFPTGWRVPYKERNPEPLFE